MYTYGCPTMDDDHNSTRKETDCGGIFLHSIRRGGSSHKRRLKSRSDSVYLYKKPSLPSNKVKLLHYTFFCAVWFQTHLLFLFSFWFVNAHYWSHLHLDSLMQLRLVTKSNFQKWSNQVKHALYFSSFFSLSLNSAFIISIIIVIIRV